MRPAATRSVEEENFRLSISINECPSPFCPPTRILNVQINQSSTCEIKTSQEKRRPFDDANEWRSRFTTLAHHFFCPAKPKPSTASLMRCPHRSLVEVVRPK